MPDFSIGCKMTQKNRTSFMYDPIPYFLCGNYSFLNLEIVANSFCYGNYSREESILGRKLYEEIRC